MEAGFQSPFPLISNMANQQLGVVNQGWSCPKCGSAHAPHVQTCPQGWGLNMPLTQPCSPYTVTCGQGTVGLQQALANQHPLASQGYNSGSLRDAKP